MIVGSGWTGSIVNCMHWCRLEIPTYLYNTIPRYGTYLEEREAHGIVLITYRIALLAKN